LGEGHLWRDQRTASLFMLFRSYADMLSVNPIF
jgi:hypothetical protein